MKTNKKMKTFIIIILFALLILSACNKDSNDENNKQEKNKEEPNTNNNFGLKEFNECLAEKGLVIYGSEWCPACQNLVIILGGKETVTPVYVECTEQSQRCSDETKTNYVPEIQINGEVYTGQRSIQALAEITGCEAPK